MNVIPMEPVARKPPPRVKKPPAPAPKAISAKTARRITWQRRSAALLGTVASAMTVVSLTHIAGGVQLITHDAVPSWQAWGVAVGLDINYIAMELGGLVTATQLVRDKLHKLTRLGIPAVSQHAVQLWHQGFGMGDDLDRQLLLPGPDRLHDPRSRAGRRYAPPHPLLDSFYAVLTAGLLGLAAIYLYLGVPAMLVAIFLIYLLTSWLEGRAPNERREFIAGAGRIECTVQVR
jgi:hypothetical protein